MAFIAVIGLLLISFSFWHYRSSLNPIAANHDAILEINLKAIGAFEMDQRNATDSDIPQSARDLDGKRVKIAGEVWAPDSATHVRNFLLTYSIAANEPRKLQRFVFCTLEDSAQAAANSSISTGATVVVTGTLHAGVVRDPQTGTILSVFRLDVDGVFGL
jgi:hypothetical protein